MIRGTVAFAITLLVMANTCLAQSKVPIGRFAADGRIVSSGLPIDAGWTPVVPRNTVVPSRGLGLEAGAHVYLLRIRAATFGVGATWMTARGKTSPPTPVQTTTGTTTTTTTTTIPDVTTRVTSFAPQVSLNFGHSLGWSYVSAGLGRAKVQSEATLASSTVTFVPRESDWVKTLNFGGGARWYVNDHIGFGFDLRWHKISLIVGNDTRPSAPRASLLVAGGGIVLK